MIIDWYPCNDGVHPGDCNGDTNTMVADERDGQPAFSVWLSDEGWCWAAWGETKPIAQGGASDQQTAMFVAQKWLDAQQRRD